MEALLFCFQAQKTFFCRFYGFYVQALETDFHWKSNVIYCVPETMVKKNILRFSGKDWVFMRKLLLITIMLVCLSLPFACSAENEALSGNILSSMTTEQKIAQLLMPAFYYHETEENPKVGVQDIYPEMEALLHKYGFGGVIFNLQNAQDNTKAVRLVCAVQAANASIPGRPQLITCTDQEGGYVTRLGQGTQMPGSMALGAVNDLSVTEAAGRLIGEEVTAVGYTGTFGPVMDVNNNPANPVIGIRSFGDRPDQVAAQGEAMIRGLHAAGAVCTLKHFPGHGDTDTDSHTGLPCVDKTYEELKAFELIPFQAGIDAGADMVMTAHIVYPQVEKETYISAETGESIHLPATLSRVILTDILRGDMGFTGLIITDAMNMDAVARHFNALDAAKLAIEAGVDLILRPVETNTLEGLAALDQYVQDVAAMADQGTLSMEAVDAAVLRVLDFKEKHGLLTPYETGDEEKRIQHALETVGSPAHHETEWEISRKAVTLIKNGNILPLNLSESTAILVPSASQIKSAEYAVARVKQEGILTDEVTVPVYHQSSLTITELIKLAQSTKHLIAVSASYSAAGMNPATKNGADTAVLDLVITLAHAAGNDVTVISAQLPYDAAHYTEADAILVSYGARGMSEDPRDMKGSVSQYGPNVPAAIYTVLSGSPAEGRLPIDLPALDENGRFTEEILYPHGLGLSVESESH